MFNLYNNYVYNFVNFVIKMQIIGFKKRLLYFEKH